MESIKHIQLAKERSSIFKHILKICTRIQKRQHLFCWSTSRARWGTSMTLNIKKIKQIPFTHGLIYLVCLRLLLVASHSRSSKMADIQDGVGRAQRTNGLRQTSRPPRLGKRSKVPTTGSLVTSNPPTLSPPPPPQRLSIGTYIKVSWVTSCIAMAMLQIWSVVL